MRFNEKGFRDEKDWLRDGRLVVEALSGTWAPYLDDYLKRLHGESVISASHIFAKNLYEQEFKWKPENELIKKIEKLIFEKKNKPRKVTLRNRRLW